MQHSIADQNGVGSGDNNLLIQRGADPLITIPGAPTHLFRRIQGLVYQVAPGQGLAPVASSLNQSEVLAVIGPAFYLDLVNQPLVGQAYPFLRGVEAPRFEDIEVALHLPPFGMDRQTIFSNRDEAADAVLKAVERAKLSGQAPPALCVLTVADLFNLQPVGQGAPNWYMDLTGANANGVGLTFSSLSGEVSGFLKYYGAFEHFFFGKNVAADRDNAANPVRVALGQLADFCRFAGFTRSAVNAPLTAGAVMQWFAATEPPEGVVFLQDEGRGLDRREQALRNRHLLAYGTLDQRVLVL